MNIAIIFLLCAQLGSGESSQDGFISDDFSERSLAHDKALAALRKGDVKCDVFLAQYFSAQDPEEKFRLKELLYAGLKEEVPQSGSGFIGINMSLEPLEKGHGVEVIGIIKDSPAEKAGLEPKDIILTVNGIELKEEAPSAQLKGIVSQLKPGKKVELEVVRENEARNFQLKLMKREALLDVLGQEATINKDVAERLLRQDFEKWLKTQKGLDQQKAVESSLLERANN